MKFVPIFQLVDIAEIDDWKNGAVSEELLKVKNDLHNTCHFNLTVRFHNWLWKFAKIKVAIVKLFEEAG